MKHDLGLAIVHPRLHYLLVVIGAQGWGSAEQSLKAACLPLCWDFKNDPQNFQKLQRWSFFSRTKSQRK
uniref:Uncharacterized protein n=1 Tax=Salvator merianae TaxID=96440 RepID=A0A8D0ED44_SALMN